MMEALLRRRVTCSPSRNTAHPKQAAAWFGERTADAFEHHHAPHGTYDADQRPQRPNRPTPHKD